MNFPPYTRFVCKNTSYTPEPKTQKTMKHITYQTILTALLITILCVIGCLATSLYWQHASVVHHAARYEANSWGITSFHWNDDSAQTPFQDPLTAKLDQLYHHKLEALDIK